MNNEAARPSAVEETLVKTEQQLYFSEVLLYFIVLYCTALYYAALYCTVSYYAVRYSTVPLLGAAHTPRQPPAVPLRGDEAQVCRLSHRRAHRGQAYL